MNDYRLVSKKNSKKDIQLDRYHPINEDDWKAYVYNSPDFIFEYDTPMGQLHRNDPEYPLDPRRYFGRAFFEANRSTFYSETQALFHEKYIAFKIPVTTIRRLDMMWKMAQALDCHLVKGNSTIIDEKKFQTLKEKYDRTKKKVKPIASDEQPSPQHQLPT
jgi:hypothetical protein